MRRTILFLTSMMSTMLIAQGAIAQTIIMRKPVTIFDSEESLPKGQWQAGDWRWSVDAPTCSDAARQERSFQCMIGTMAVPASRCSGTAGETARTQPRYDSCTTRWVAAGFGPWSSQCSHASIRTQSLQCIRSGGDSKPTAVSDAQCPNQRPDTRETSEILAGCTYAWQTGAYSNWSSTCSESATRSRTVTCQRSGGDITSEIAADSFCMGSGTKPDTAEGGSIMTGCTYAWTRTPGSCIGSGQRSSTVTCTRSGQGSTPITVADSFCSAVAKPAATYSDSTCVVSTTCAVPVGGHFFTDVPAYPDGIELGEATTEQGAQSLCNAYLKGKSVVGVCFWDSNSNNLSYANRRGGVSFRRNSTVYSTPSYPQFYASTCSN